MPGFLDYQFERENYIAGSNTEVLLLGETGTGKELVATALHGRSLRKHRALIKVNCSALPRNLSESTLFGHEKGASTGSHSRHLGRFEVANGATLFSIPPHSSPRVKVIRSSAERSMLMGAVI